MKLLEQNGMHFVKCYSVLYHYIYSGKSLEKPVAFFTWDSFIDTVSCYLMTSCL